MKGKFIVLYGANNLGKSLQVKLLQKSLGDQNINVVSIKYPIYGLVPTGPRIDAILRGKEDKPSELEFQSLYVQNRRDFETVLKKYLEDGVWVIAEDYKGTGIAWGLVRGLKLEELEDLNKNLLDEDLAILLYGKRFKEGIEKNHINEKDESIWQMGQDKHLFLAKRYGWKKVLANNTPGEVHNEIWGLVKPFLPT